MCKVFYDLFRYIDYNIVTSCDSEDFSKFLKHQLLLNRKKDLSDDNLVFDVSVRPQPRSLQLIQRSTTPESLIDKCVGYPTVNDFLKFCIHTVIHLNTFN